MANYWSLHEPMGIPQLTDSKFSIDPGKFDHRRSLFATDSHTWLLTVWQLSLVLEFISLKYQIVDQYFRNNFFVLYILKTYLHQWWTVISLMFHDTQANISGGFVMDSLKIHSYVIASQGLQTQFMDFSLVQIREVFSHFKLDLLKIDT